MDIKTSRLEDGRTRVYCNSVCTEVRDLNLNIEDLKVYKVSTYVDDRGYVRELWRKGYFFNDQVEQVYFATCTKGVIKAWHYHKVHTDRLIPIKGRVKIGFVDMRPGSKYFENQDSIVIDANINPMIVEVPPMVYHGQMGLSDEEVILLNVATHVYDPTDEYKMPVDYIDFDWKTRNR